MSRQPPDDGFDPEDAPPSVSDPDLDPDPDPDPDRVWAALGVSAAAGLHIVVAALILINRSH
ncbi:hypothetical protein ACIPLC_05850 [Kitasatospora sp. NPDC086801]|uniref:hypothetical protein n=1 Tax=Kitasatospora sp. NPDC086801 TaxID=3364066 RepID=UPI00381C80D7